MHIAIYARVSTADQRDGRTIQSQLEELKRVALAQNHVVVRSYIDDGYSGALLNRPGLDRLRDEAAQSDFEGVLVNDVDRLSRDVAHLAVVRRDLERKNVKLMFSKLPNEEGPLNNFMVNILGSFAEFERALIADRTRRGKRHKTEDRGLIMGNIPPYGYDYVKKDKDRGLEGRYTINKAEAEVVREMFSWAVDEGLSVRAVMRRLNELRIPARHASSWAKSSTARVLANETYAGTTHYNKHNTMPYASDEYRPPKRRLRRRADWVPITLPSHLHLISKGTFERAQEQRRKSRVHSPRGSRYFYLLRYVRRICARCRKSYSSTPCHGKRYYRCSNRCGSKTIRAHVVEAAVWGAIEQIVQDPVLLASQVKAYEKRAKSRERATRVKRDESRTSVIDVEREEERILAAYRRGLVTMDQFADETRGLRKRRAVLAARLAESDEVTREAGSAKRLRGDIRSWIATVQGRLATMPPADRQRFLGHLLEEVVISDDEFLVRGVIPTGGLVGTSPKGSAHKSAGRAGEDGQHHFQLRVRRDERPEAVLSNPRTELEEWTA